MSSAERIVFDTNTLIGALLTPDSPPRHALTAALARCKLYGSEATLAELESVILRAKFDRYLNRTSRKAFAAMIRQHTQLVPAPRTDEARLPRACRDPRDNKFLALAIAAQADVMVTSGADLTIMHPYEGIAIIHADAFLALTLAQVRGET